MKIYASKKRAVKFHAIFQLALAFLLFSETSCGSTKYVYEGPDGCSSNDCSCETEKKVEQVNDELVTTSTTTCYNISSYSGPGEFFVRKIPQPVVNGIRKVRGFMVNQVNQARSYCQNVHVNENLVKAKDNMAVRASELKNKIGATYDTTKGKLGTFWQRLHKSIFGEKVDNVVSK